MVVSVVVTSFCAKYWQLIVAQGVLTGVGMGLIFGSGANVLMSYFSKRIGVATGIAASGGAVGEALLGLFWGIKAHDKSRWHAFHRCCGAPRLQDWICMDNTK